MSKFLPIEKGSDLRWDLLRSALLTLVVVLVWCAAYDRWTITSWQTPLEYLSDPEKGDVISLFATVKAAGEGHISFLFSNNIPELGAPHVANWDDYPWPEKPLFCLTGLLSLVIGLFPAANFMVLLAHILAATAFYSACRLLNGAWTWAFAGALIFAFARYAFAHGLHHLTILYYWHVPLCLVASCWVIRGEAIGFGSPRFRFALLVAAITGVQNVYYANMFVQFVLIGGLLQGWRRGWRLALPAGAIALTTIGAFLLMCANTFLHTLTHGPNTAAVDRSYRWLEVYGLKLVDMVMPPPDHSFPPFAAWSVGHLKEVILPPGEMPPTAYLGVISLGALAWLVVYSWRRLVASEKLPLEAWLILWIILYSEVGGIDGILGTFGFELFRTATRYSIFILCIALMFAVQRLSLMEWRNKLLAYGTALLAVVFALWDQTPPFVSDADIAATAQTVESDRNFTEQMEQRLPVRAMVFQIPVIDFPEGPVPGVGPYEHFRPYIYSRRLRFSFGSDKGRPSGEWQHAVEHLQLKDLVARLESYGFAALYVNVNSMNDGGANFIKALQGFGYKDMFRSDRGDLLCVMLKPSPQPVMPDSE